jgi:hypothetical protein
MAMRASPDCLASWRDWLAMKAISCATPSCRSRAILRRSSATAASASPCWAPRISSTAASSNVAANATPSTSGQLSPAVSGGAITRRWSSASAPIAAAAASQPTRASRRAPRIAKPRPAAASSATASTRISSTGRPNRCSPTSTSTSGRAPRSTSLRRGRRKGAPRWPSAATASSAAAARWYGRTASAQTRSGPTVAAPKAYPRSATAVTASATASRKSTRADVRTKRSASSSAATSSAMPTHVTTTIPASGRGMASRVCGTTTAMSVNSAAPSAIAAGRLRSSRCDPLIRRPSRGRRQLPPCTDPASPLLRPHVSSGDLGDRSTSTSLYVRPRMDLTRVAPRVRAASPSCPQSPSGAASARAASMPRASAR